MRSTQQLGCDLTTVVLVLALLALMLPLFQGLGLTDLRNDEAIYAYAVDSILESGDWWAPRESLTDQPYLSKPPLKIWLVAAGIRLGVLPHDERGMRLLDAIFAALALVYVFLIGARLIDPVAGLAAAALLILMPSLLFHHGLRDGGMEAMLLLQFSATVYHLLAWRHSPSHRWRVAHILIIAGWQAFGVLGKSTALLAPAALAPIVLFSGGWRRHAWRDRWWWIAGITLATACIVPWFVIQASRHGDLFWRQFVGQAVVQRYNQGLDPSHLEPWHYYLTFLTRELTSAGALPWVAVGAVLWLWRIVRQRWADGLLIVLWLVVPLALISTSASKLRHYLYPSLPAVALFGGLAFSTLAAFCAHRIQRWLGSRAKPRRDLLLSAAVLALGLWPWSQYRHVLARSQHPQAPYQAVRQCVDELGPEVILGPGWKGRLFYVYSPWNTVRHPSFYYFRHLDSWQRQRKPDEALLYFRLFVKGHQAPTLIPARDYLIFSKRITSDDVQAAVHRLLPRLHTAGLEAELPDMQGLEPPPALQITRSEILLLPGPYAACLEPAQAAGGLTRL